MSAFLALLSKGESIASRDFPQVGPQAIARFGQPSSLPAQGSFQALVADSPPARPPLHGTAPDGTSIVGWARLDEREALAQQLGLNGANEGDGALLLHAYARFGAGLVEHLRGEFSFVVWDHGKQRLVATTDRFGIHPLFRMDIDGDLYFSDSLHVLRAIGGDALTVDEETLGDIACLAFATNPQATIYRQVRRLAPATVLTLADGNMLQHPYWRPDEPVSPLIYKDDRDYIEEFRELFLASVRNRIIPDRPVGIMMSGGMDSTSVAAGAALAVGKDAARLVTAHTALSELYNTVEGDLAQQTAARLGIGFCGHDETGVASATPAETPDFIPSQPGSIPELSPALNIARRLGNEGGVLMSGMGGDMILGCRSPTILDTLRSDGWRSPLTLAKHLRHRARLPSSGLSRLRSVIAARRPPRVPLFIDEQFARRTHLHERLAEYRAALSNDMAGRLVDPFWTNILSDGATSETAMPLEVAHPFVDQRLLEFSRRLPASLLGGKQILREAMRRDLPDDVLNKPKTLLGYSILTQRQLPEVQARHANQLVRSREKARHIFDIANLERCIRTPQVAIAHPLTHSESVLWWLEKTSAPLPAAPSQAK